MGLSSSQARLLHLTGRMHQLEYKAQKLEAQKLQLANESSRVYEDYENALDSTKIQYKSLNVDGTVTYRDANMNIMQNGIVSDYDGEISNETLFLQTQDGKIMVTPTVADKYGLSTTTDETRTMDEFIQQTTGKNKSTKEVYKDVPVYRDEKHMVPVTDKTVENITGSNKVSNTVESNPVDNLQYAPVGNKYIESVSNYLSNVDATIGVATPLDFQTLLTHSELWNRDFVMETDVDLSGINWTGIGSETAQFTGSFNGNGHTIKNLTMNTNSKGYGLFAFAKDATIENISIDNANITSTISGSGSADSKYDSHVGGLVGQAEGNTVVRNCSVTNSNVSGYSDVALLIGHMSEKSKAENCYVQGTVYSSNADAGGITGQLGDDSSVSTKATASIKNCYSNCTVTIPSGYGYAGGIAGKNTGIGSITNCRADGTVSAPKNYGDICSTASFDNESSLSDTQSTWSSSIWETTGTNPSLKVQNSEDYINVSTLVSGANSAVISPSFKSIASNIEYTFDKAGITGISNSDILNWLNTNYGANNDANNRVAASLNKYAEEYLTDKNATNTDFAEKLANDIKSGTTNQSASYQTYYNNQTGLAVQRGYNEAACTKSGAKTKGKVTIPSVNTIANELYYRLVQKDSTITQSKISNWLNNFTSSDEGKATLANINEMINNNSDLSEILTAINGNDTSYNNTSKYNAEKWNVNIKTSDDSITPTYGSKTTEEWDGTYDKVIDHYNPELDYTEEYWDTTDPDIANAISIYTIAKHGVIVVTDEQAKSSDYLTNILNGGYAVLTSFNPEKVSEFVNLPQDQINNMTEEEYDKFMGIENTSVSVNTSLREVSNEKNLKKAEAQYEADMKRIDLKDRKYDTDLAALETERNATKEEMETLKTVAKDNVDRTFKLFG